MGLATGLRFGPVGGAFVSAAASAFYIPIAEHILTELGVDARTFLDAMGQFNGASRRLELLASHGQTNIYRDFAHAPSKVKATIHAVRQQFPLRRLIAVLELHTYSSLNQEFMKEYAGSMEEADLAVVFYAQHALEIKKLPALPPQAVTHGFAKEGLQVIHDRPTLEAWLEKQSYENTNLLLMSSGNYDGMDMLTFATKVLMHD